MNKIWLLILGLIASTGCGGSSDHTGKQDQQSEPVSGSTVSSVVYVGHSPPTFWPPETTTTSTVVTTTTTQPPAVEVVTPTGDVWWDLFGCETGYTYNPRIVSASGTYRGAFQFDLETWQGVGETGDPIDYSYEHQLAAAKRLHAARGWSPWPKCSRDLGLR